MGKRTFFKSRRIILIFSLVILLPTVIIGILGLRTLNERRDILEQTLSSTLVTAVGSALETIEDTLLASEAAALSPDIYEPLIVGGVPLQPVFSELTPGGIHGRRFILDSLGQVVFPRTGSDNEEDLSVLESPAATGGDSFKEAGSQEFFAENYRRAAELYDLAFRSLKEMRGKARALEGRARCLKKAGRMEEATGIYLTLSKNYMEVLDGAGHPYGLSAAWQRAKILSALGNSEGPEEILSLYIRIREGAWPLTEAAFALYSELFEAQLDELLTEETDAGLKKSYRQIKSSPAPYTEILGFSDFLRIEIAPRIKTLNQTLSEGRVERIAGVRAGDPYLSSFALLTGREGENSYVVGCCWDLDVLYTATLPSLTRALSSESGMELAVIRGGEEGLRGVSTQERRGEVEMSFRRLPLPWKVAASQPSLLRLRRSAGRDMLVFGILLVVIFGLMVFGAVLLARDIVRESEINRLKSDFVHNVSHELKTPLTLIQLYGETLQNKSDLNDEDRSDAHEIITKESERLTHLINNVLDFSRMELGKREYRIRKESLPDIVLETLEAYRYHFENKGFSVETDIERGMSLIRLDKEAVIGALVNLLSNAIKFSGDSKKISVLLQKRDKEVWLSIKDWGIGMTKAEVGRIFERFYRAGSHAADVRGSGIGLSLVKHMAEAHGGKIEVKSSPGKGSLFSMVFPLEEKSTADDG